MSTKSHHISDLERFYKYVLKTEHCWIWVGAKSSSGYGQFYANGIIMPAHRYLYEQIYKCTIPKILQIDHLCRNHSCVNPSHLDVVTVKENSRRGLSSETTRNRMLSKTYCPHGHEYSVSNTYITREGWRQCRICHNNAVKLSFKRIK